MSVWVTVKPQSDGKPLTLARGLPTKLKFDGQTSQTVTISQVKAALFKKHPRFSVHRQKLATLNAPKSALGDDKTIAEIIFDEGKGGALASAPDNHNVEITLTVKDLGPQVSWRTVFLVEYFGPLVIHPLVFYFPRIFYRRDFQHSTMQYAVLVLVLTHFLKRELETLFVHRFSHATMPVRNIFKNSAHYHLLSGVLLAGATYGPWYGAKALAGTSRAKQNWILGWAALWAIAELQNLQAHLTLRNLRPVGTRTRGIPYGGLFALVSCPNYFTEILAWVAITGLTLSPAALFFTVVSSAQMGIWALKKHKAYKREFGEKYPKRKKMIPFIW